MAVPITQEQDKIIKLVQISTQNILNSYTNRAQLLAECSNDVKLLVREGYDPNIAENTAERLFGTKNNIQFLAIDGTKSEDEALEMIIFYAGAFGYTGKLDFTNNIGCTCNEPTALKETFSISTAIPIHEENVSMVAGQLKESGIDVDTERIPSGLMHLAEYYMAVRALQDNHEIKVLIFDRMPSIDIPHLISNVEELLDTDNDFTNRCILEGMETEYGVISALDLELARMLHSNDSLGIPPARSHLITWGERQSKSDIRFVLTSPEKVSLI